MYNSSFITKEPYSNLQLREKQPSGWESLKKLHIILPQQTATDEFEAHWWPQWVTERLKNQIISPQESVEKNRIKLYCTNDGQVFINKLKC